MAWFRRPDAEPEPLPSDDELVDQVDEGMLIIAAGLRMSMRNRIVVDVLRDGRDVDDAALVASVREAIQALVDEKARSVERLERVRSRAARRRGRAEHGADYRERDVAPLARRTRIEELLVERLEAVCADEARMLEIVRAARRSALDELVETVTRQLAAPPPARDDAGRQDRIASLRDELAGLEPPSAGARG